MTLILRTCIEHYHEYQWIHFPFLLTLIGSRDKAKCSGICANKLCCAGENTDFSADVRIHATESIWELQSHAKNEVVPRMGMLCFEQPCKRDGLQGKFLLLTKGSTSLLSINGN